MTEELTQQTVRLVEEVEIDDPSNLEQLLRSVILGYQEGWNKHNDKYELEYLLTVTTHKMPAPDGTNKDVAYLRLVRGVREKGLRIVPNPDETLPDIKEEHPWSQTLIHQEVYLFKNIKEQANPKAPWRDQLYLNCIARLMSAGLEYAELLKRLKSMEAAKEEEKKSGLDLVITDQMPKALSPDEENYKKWVQENNINAKPN